MLLQSLALAWLAGSALVALGVVPALGVVVALLALTQVRHLRLSRVAPSVLLLLATGAAGAASMHFRPPAAGAGDASHFVDDGPTRVQGVVDGDTDVLLRSVLVHLRVQRVEDDRGWHPASGTVLLRLPASADLHDGDLVEARGRLRAPSRSGTFDYAAELARQGIYAEADYPIIRRLGNDSAMSIPHILALLRGRLDGGIRSVLPEPEASLSAGLVFGTTRIREPAFTQALRTTNADMLAVATGFNVTLVGLTTLAALGPLVGRRQAALLGILTMILYSAVIGPYPSVLRALLMTSAVLAASIFGRPYSAARLLLLACAGMIALDPSSMTSVSLPLSLSATGGVVWLLGPLRQWLQRLPGLAQEATGRRGYGRAVLDTLATTIAATIAALPVVIAVTHTFSLGSLPANLLLFPLIPWLMASSGAVAVAGALGHSAGLIAAPVAYVLLWGMVEIVRLCAALPGSDLPLPWYGPKAATATYVLAAAAVAAWQGRASPLVQAPIAWIELRVGWLGRRMLDCARPFGATRWPWERPARSGPRVALPAGLPLAMMLLSPLLLLAPIGAARATVLQPQTSVTYLDVGQGTAILVQSGSQRILIDGGPAGEGTVRALDRVLPPWQRSISLLVVTQRSAARVGGLPAVLQHYRVGAVLDATAPPPVESAPANAAWNTWQRALTSSRVRRLSRRPAAQASIGEGTLEIDSAVAAGDGRRLAPAGTAFLQVDGQGMLLTGDQTASRSATVRMLSPSDLTPPRTQATVLLVSTDSPVRFDARTLPEGFGRPLAYSTSANGDVTLDVRRGRMMIHSQRGTPERLPRQ